MSTLFLVGATNPEGVRLALHVNRASSRWEKIVIVDDDVDKRGRDVLGLTIVGTLDELHHAAPEDEVCNLVARKTSTRAKVRERILGMGRRLTRVVHPSVDTLGVELPTDVTVYPHANLGAGSRLGEGSVVFMNGTVGHGATVGECCVIAAGGVLNARVVLGDRVYVGTNASVLPDLRLGDDVTVGACSSVVRHVPDRATVLGVPGEVLREAAPRLERVVVEHEVETAEAHDTDGAEIRERLARAWTELLGGPPQGRAHFFESGGTSLLALDLCARMRDLHVELVVSEVFAEPRFEALVDHLRRREGASAEDSLRDVRERAARRVQRRVARS